MHIDYKFIGAMLGLGFWSATQKEKHANGQALVTELILAAGNGDEDYFYQLLAPYTHKLQAGVPRRTWPFAVLCAEEMQSWKNGYIQHTPNVLNFRKWCTDIV